jgi:hypothetical protein
MRHFLMVTLVVLACSVSGAFAQCGPHHQQVCQPGKVPDAGAFGSDYSTCHASSSQGQQCWTTYWSQMFFADGTVYSVTYCAAVSQDASCYCVQNGAGQVTTSGTCTVGAT